MKACRKSDGEIIEVKEWRGASDVIYSSPDMNQFYQASELDFNIDAEDTVIQGWVARNRYNELYLYTEKPHRIICGIVFGEHTDAWSSGDLSFFPLDKELFPDISWDDDPIEVEIIIKIKNNENNSKPSA